MHNLRCSTGDLTNKEQQIITAGFAHHSNNLKAPAFDSKRVNWLIYDDQQAIIGALTADIVWDWLYIDELWVDESVRGQGYGKQLMHKVQSYALMLKLSGIWLWTQSWQAADFYRYLEYDEFARFADFPTGYSRIGFRKIL